MQLIRGNAQLKHAPRIIATIGNFDGMHAGHQAILQRLTELAEQHDAKTCVMSFEPLPHEVFSADAPPARLHGTRDRLQIFESFGVDFCLLHRFNEAFRTLSAEDFIQSILLKQLNIHTLIVGDDFRFGKNRKGSFSTLKQAGEKHGFTVEDTPTIIHQGKRISSTRIRDALSENKLDEAAELLGRPYRISGRVMHGEKVGSQLGFPTANIAIKKQTPPLQGVFAVNARCEETQETYSAVANLGRRPTVNGLKLLLEVHLLDVTVDLYGKHMQIDFMHHLRGEVKFDSLDELRAQIGRDADKARALLSKL